MNLSWNWLAAISKACMRFWLIGHCLHANIAFFIFNSWCMWLTQNWYKEKPDRVPKLFYNLKWDDGDFSGHAATLLITSKPVNMIILSNLRGSPIWLRPKAQHMVLKNIKLCSIRLLENGLEGVEIKISG